MEKRIYIVIWNKLVAWLTPPVLRPDEYVSRIGTLVAFIKAVVAPVNDLHTRLLTFRNNVNYRLGITPQVCYLEKALNDRYDIDMRRIDIVDATERNPLPMFLKAENKPVKLYNKASANHLTLYTKGETAQFTVDFIVRVGVLVDFDINEMTAFINSLKLLGKTFKIMIF